MVYDGAVRQEVSGRLLLDPGTFFGRLKECVWYGNTPARAGLVDAVWAGIETVNFVSGQSFGVVVFSSMIEAS